MSVGAGPIVIVGAGLAGLTAARALVRSGHEVVVLDKGRSVGGRMATRRIETAGGTARLDHGPQFFTARSDRFRAVVDGWVTAGIAREWYRPIAAPGEPDTGTTRHVGVTGMNAVAKYMSVGLETRCDQFVEEIRQSPGQGWRLRTADGDTIDTSTVIVTTPLPQAFAMLVGTDVAFPERLVRTEYDRTIALLVVLDGESAVPPPGGLRHPDDVFSFVGDQCARGVSEIPAITLHANDEWSEAHWDTDPTVAGQLLLDAGARWFGGARVLTHEVKRWRYATPRTIWPEPCFAHRRPDGAFLALAGDAFDAGTGGAKVEAAVLSGIAAAAAATHDQR
jgi:renalase